MLTKELPALAFPRLDLDWKAFCGFTNSGRPLDNIFYPSCKEERPVILFVLKLRYVVAAGLVQNYHTGQKTKSGDLCFILALVISPLLCVFSEVLIGFFVPLCTFIHCSIDSNPVTPSSFRGFFHYQIGYFSF